MKRLLTSFLLLLAVLQAWGREYEVHGALGGIVTKLSLPKDFDPQTDSCDLVILMHGFWVNSDAHPIPHASRFFLKKGFATLSFDFGGCGYSEGKSTQMTVETLLTDARAIYYYARSLPFVRKILFLGHSQGGLVAGMLAGRLATEGIPPESVFLLAPASVIPDYAKDGKFFGITCDPVDPPESISIYGYRISREYILVAQNLKVYEEASAYTGPAFVIHGTKDTIVPYSYGVTLHEALPGSTMYTIPGEGHVFLFIDKLDSILSECLERLAL